MQSPASQEPRKSKEMVMQSPKRKIATQGEPFSSTCNSILSYFRTVYLNSGKSYMPIKDTFEKRHPNIPLEETHFAINIKRHPSVGIRLTLERHSIESQARSSVSV
jgi:hypothetical protein